MALPPPQGNNMYFLIWEGPRINKLRIHLSILHLLTL